MSPFTVLILIAFAVDAFSFIDQETELNFTDEPLQSEDPSNQIGEWEGRIIGGKDAQPGQFPHQAQIRFDGVHGCGGSILNRFFVLTAAHCFPGPNSTELVQVAVGAHFRSNDGIVHEVHSLHAHPEFDSQIISNDIGIIRTATEILFDTPFVRQVTLPSTNVPDAGNLEVIISGWGVSFRSLLAPWISNRHPRVLQYKDALTLNRRECIARHGTLGRLVHENTVCVQNPRGRGACFGDSGGPLITQSGVQVGVVSWARGCARGYPDVYASVWSHIEWIKATISENRN